MKRCDYRGHEWVDRDVIEVIDESVAELVCLHCDAYQVVRQGNTNAE